ncbi:MAG: hypothetical protein JXR76_28870 [Deltaproteobacteria bacterium]|nr:hypothetical protein [Deltaproteobacteria bacterium]
MLFYREMKNCLVIGCFAFCSVITPNAHGADTVEPFDIGATDFEMYIGMDGFGLEKYEKTVFSEVVLGYGILERMSAYFSTSLAANEYFADGTVGFAFGIYGNVVDTHHFDVDLFLDFSGTIGDFAVTPALELNVDADPQMGSVGLYLRTGAPLFGRDVALADALEPDYELATQIDGTLGFYATLGEAHQLLLEFDGALRPAALKDEYKVEMGGAAVGYNVMLADNLELINQVVVDIPNDDEEWSVGVSTGFIATLP